MIARAQSAIPLGTNYQLLPALYVAHSLLTGPTKAKGQTARGSNRRDYFQSCSDTFFPVFYLRPDRQINR